MQPVKRDHIWTGFCCEEHTYQMIDAAFELPFVARVCAAFFSFSLYLSSLIMPRRDFLASLGDVVPDERYPRIYRTSCYRSLLEARLSGNFRRAWERRVVVVVTQTVREHFPLLPL